jgi:glycosyltransferase involved in cell wall biosynthesis
MKSRLRVIVAQMGARHNYALPRMLHNHGALERFYTDTYARGLLARAADLWPRRIDFAFFGKLRRRTIDGIPHPLIYSDPLVNVRGAFSSASSKNERYRIEDTAFGRRMIEWGVGNANVVYGVYGSGVPFWRYAKERGLKVAADIFTTPLYHRIVAREQEAFPDWEEPVAKNAAEREITDEVSRDNIETADLLLCPSQTVANDVTTFVHILSPRLNVVLPPIAVVPYGIKAARRPRQPPMPGRILFVGGASLGKGIHYLAEAATTLAGTAKPYEFRVAGQVSDLVRKHRKARALTFLGHLSRERLDEEFAKADIFVLPTLAEGSATVVHEALAARLPVITTLSAGSVVVNGREGLIVPERDAGALAAAIARLVEDRSMREAMAEAALATAAEFDEAPWGERLIRALSPLVGECGNAASS